MDDDIIQAARAQLDLDGRWLHTWSWDEGKSPYDFSSCWQTGSRPNTLRYFVPLLDPTFLERTRR